MAKMMSSLFKICVFISGTGSNLDSIIKKQKQHHYQVNLVISDKENAKGLKYAREANIPTYTFKWDKKDKSLSKICHQINQHQCELIVLAGFMRILPKEFIEAFENKIINIHPSLLPKYKGLHTHQQVIDNNDTIHGASVHYVNAKLDAGKTISQTIIVVKENDDANLLAKRLLFREHSLLPHTIAFIGQNRVKWRDKELFFDQNILTKPVILHD